MIRHTSSSFNIQCTCSIEYPVYQQQQFRYLAPMYQHQQLQQQFQYPAQSAYQQQLQHAAPALDSAQDERLDDNEESESDADNRSPGINLERKTAKKNRHNSFHNAHDYTVVRAPMRYV